MNAPRPLSLDDIASYGPDRDNERVFRPGATWEQACGFVLGGYSAEEVAGIILDLPIDDLVELRDLVADPPVIPGSPAMRILRQLALLDSDIWVPTFSTAGVYDLVDQRDNLLAALKAILALPGDDDASSVAIAIPHDTMEEARAAIAAAEGEG